jgi:C4-dicarboxylate transporter, DctM subunit
MSLTAIGIIGIMVLVAILFSGIPVAFAMILVGMVGYAIVVSTSAALNMVIADFLTTFSSYSFTTAIMFVLMGAVVFYSGASGRLYNSAYKIFGKMAGGLAIATIAASTVFAAVSGSCVTSVAAMGKVAFPEMKKHAYDDGLAAGAVAAGGSLGPLIPPSVVFIVYGILTGTSIGKLFIAGIVPGLMLSLLFMFYVYFRCRKNPELGPGGEATTLKGKVTSLSGTAEMVILFALVIGGLFVGIFTPTEAGAIGALGAIILALFRRKLSWKNFINSLKDTAPLTAMAFLILAGAVIFGHFLAITRIPMELATWVEKTALPGWAVMLLIIFIYLIGGCFIDALALVMLTIPIFFPVVTALGFDAIWFGVIVVLVTNMGLMTPPVGVAAFVITGVSGIPLTNVFRGIYPFLGIIIAVTVFYVFVPQIILFLPNLMK